MPRSPTLSSERSGYRSPSPGRLRTRQLSRRAALSMRPAGSSAGTPCLGFPVPPTHDTVPSRAITADLGARSAANARLAKAQYRVTPGPPAADRRRRCGRVVCIHDRDHSCGHFICVQYHEFFDLADRAVDIWQSGGVGDVMAVKPQQCRPHDRAVVTRIRGVLESRTDQKPSWHNFCVGHTATRRPRGASRAREELSHRASIGGAAAGQQEHSEQRPPANRLSPQNAG